MKNSKSAGSIKEVHIDEPKQRMQFGGDESIDGDETGKDQPPTALMTMENIRNIVRKILKEIIK